MPHCELPTVFYVYPLPYEKRAHIFELTPEFLKKKGEGEKGGEKKRNSIMIIM